MKYKTNYDILHVHELETALEAINEHESPEEAEYIRKLINEGGYKPAVAAIYSSAEITNNYFKWSLLLLLSFFLLLNSLVFVTTLYPFSLIPILFQITLITLIFRKSPHIRALVKLWSALMVIGSVANLLSIYLTTDTSNIAVIVEKMVLLLIGIAIFWLSGKYIVLNENASNN